MKFRAETQHCNFSAFDNIYQSSLKPFDQQSFCFIHCSGISGELLEAGIVSKTFCVTTTCNNINVNRQWLSLHHYCWNLLDSHWMLQVVNYMHFFLFPDLKCIDGYEENHGNHSSYSQCSFSAFNDIYQSSLKPSELHSSYRRGHCWIHCSAFLVIFGRPV